MGNKVSFDKELMRVQRMAEGEGDRGGGREGGSRGILYMPTSIKQVII